LQNPKLDVRRPAFPGAIMADMLSTSVSGLLAFQRALDTTSHNISNSGTVGYSRQLTELMTRGAQQSGNGWVGNGVEVSTVKRS
jgi:flagellar hook-associated protein 1 FlgK